MSRSLRRLMKEASELSSSPSPHFHAAPVSDSNLYDWHFTLAGPPAPSPYAGGIYHGRIVLPPTYPLRPPSFRFLTPSGRFEVNREICLSISGHHEETWQPAWGIRTALLAIRSFMDGDVKGQVGGLEGVSEAIKREWAVASRKWCCEVCGNGRSNEEVLREWREFCVERGVDVEREQEVEGVPEELRIGIKKAEGDSDTPKAGSEMEAGASAVSSSNRGDDADCREPTAPAQTGTAAPTPVPNGPLPTPSSIPTQVPTNGTRPESAPTSQVRVQQQQQPISAAASSQAARVASQDSPWLDRAIFGVLVALVLMILRRVIDIED